MLQAMHNLIRRLTDLEVFTTACVRGRCLGGGLEVALACDRIVASPNAELGQPEIKLGVFAPVASVLLGLRVGEARAVQLLAGGHAIAAREALAEGLVDAVADAPEDEARAWARHHLEDKSAVALRHAVWAARRARRRAVGEDLPAVERRYLEELMRTHDAQEGVRAFMEKRPPVFEDR
jgi:cyclohexa-1,5-dienecarbonyl-CoA hydratase